MEEKIKELINSTIVLDEEYADEFALKIIQLFEQEKQSYAKEMCEKAFTAGIEYSVEFFTHQLKTIPDSYEWIKKNFPEK